ncbi:hypothetical protein [Caballeronia arationis]|uniref:hypothetical protein n=1 Tax=Caballeronia arationis TaxID=1777142 RepID=UPI0011981D7B|nr:hypothetical protein [Caballeronia arationis]
MKTKTVTAAALEAAQHKLADAQKTAIECRTNHANALNTVADHRNEAAVHCDKAKATRAELRDVIGDCEALAEHHATEGTHE